MASILIKDTTKEERERIVAEALGDEYGFGCGFEVGFPEDNPRSSCMSE